MAAAAVAGAGALWWGWYGTSASATVPTLDYTLLDGSVRHTRDFQGQVVLVNFWATSCSTCVKEMPEIVQTYNRFKDRGFKTVAVAMSYDPPAYVANFAQSRQLPFEVAIDNTGQIAQAFGPVRLTPTTFLINRRGEVVKHYLGQPDFKALHALIDDLLKSGG